MNRPTAVALALFFGSVADAQEAPPAAPPPAVAPSTPGAPGERGGAEAGPAAGGPLRVPELLARTPEVARLGTLLGVEILDESGEPVALLDDLAARGDGQLVAILARPDGSLVGLTLAELTARAKPDPPGTERATIRSFNLARLCRRFEAAPEIEDKSRLDADWLAKLDSGTPAAPRPSGPAAGPSSAPEAAPAAAEPSPLALLGALRGRRALDADGQLLGTLVDVVVAVPAARVAYLVVLRPDGPDGPGALHAVPFAALGPPVAEDGVRLSIGAQELQTCPRIDALARLPVDPLATAGEPAAPAERPAPGGDAAPETPARPR